MVSEMIQLIIVLSLYYLLSQKFSKSSLHIDYSPFYEKNNILHENNFGFTPGRNTTHAILSLVDNILRIITYVVASFKTSPKHLTLYVTVFS